MPSSTRGTVSAAVKTFYRDTPFNYYSSVAASVAALKSNALPSMYPDLNRVLRSGEVDRVLEFGCGAGWLANTMAAHYSLPVAGVDFTRKAIERARDVANALNVADLATFVECDLFEFSTAAVDLVVSIGVIPATHDARASFEHMQKHVRPGKYIYLGLYHHYGRKAFREMFERVLEEEGEEAAFRRYAKLDPIRASDPVHLRSWFRDQVLHPHENHQTLKEVAGWCTDFGLELRSTSINRFEPFDRAEPLFELEKEYEQLSYRANHIDGRFFPGFFTILAQRRT